LRGEEKREPKKRRKRKPGSRVVTGRIVLNRKVDRGQEIRIKGPLMEAFRFQGSRPGSLITLTDAEGNDFRGRVLHLSDEEASILIFDRFPLPTESSVEIFLLQALPEKERMELIIQKATELGVTAIFPFKSERSISLAERDSIQKKSHRWQEGAAKAVQQSRRARIPEVKYYPSLDEVLRVCGTDGLKILLWEKEGENLKSVLSRSRSREIYALVGPEGGWTQEEVSLARKAGFIPIKLGQRILRTETAAIILVGILQYELGDLS
jgi:16S rRNA (uracil1498-N3)-methyltransferase